MSRSSGRAVDPPAYGVGCIDRHRNGKPLERRARGLPEALQQRMESAFQADFSDVAVHADSTRAATMGALAYTEGSDLHFAPGQYSPGSSRGRELIGHELAHVLQQRDGRVRATSRVDGVAVNDDQGLERDADRQSRRALQAQPVRPMATAKGETSRQSAVQRKQESSFPEELTEEQMGGAAQMRRSPASARSSNGETPTQHHGGPRAVMQMRGGPTVGRLCVISNAVNEGLTAGHAWLSYTPTGGLETTYGTWGNRDPIGLHTNLEVGRPFKARRCTDVDAVDVASLGTFRGANDSWSYVNNCASFAARGWLAATGERVAYTTVGIPNPSALGDGITKAGGQLAADADTGSSASSGSSYGSSSVSSVGPGSSG